jgi:hypothetical protein
MRTSKFVRHGYPHPTSLGTPTSCVDVPFKRRRLKAAFAHPSRDEAIAYRETVALFVRCSLLELRSFPLVMKVGRTKRRPWGLPQARLPSWLPPPDRPSASHPPHKGPTMGRDKTRCSRSFSQAIALPRAGRDPRRMI